MSIKYLHCMMFGSSGSLLYCVSLNAIGTSCHVIGMNMLAQIAFVRFLYTNVWHNIRCTHDDLWANLIRCYNMAQFLIILPLALMFSQPQDMKMALCLGVPRECLATFMGAPIFPAWANVNMYTLLVLMISSILSRKSRKARQRLNDMFIRRLGQNSRFGKEHVGVAHLKVAIVLAVIFSVVVLLDVLASAMFEPQDYRKMPASTYHHLFEVSSRFLAIVVLPIVFHMAEKKIRRWLLKQLKLFFTRATPVYELGKDSSPIHNLTLDISNAEEASKKVALPET